MNKEGLHFICEKHEEETRYCPLDMKWVCTFCEIETGVSKRR